MVVATPLKNQNVGNFVLFHFFDISSQKGAMTSFMTCGKPRPIYSTLARYGLIIFKINIQI